MTNPIKISSNGSKVVPFLILFCVFFTFASFAQNERDRNIPELTRNNDSANQFESPESSVLEQKTENYQRQSIPSTRETKIGSTTPQAKKDNPIYKMGGEKEIRKEGMSTLSFNLFLYIVDKFKED